MIPVGLIGIPLLGFMLLVGIRLIRRGLAGTRIGASPYCRTCGYNLTGRVSARCSECGTLLGEADIVIGVWKLRSRSLLLGLVLFLTSAPGLGIYKQWARTPIDIISHTPNLVLVVFAKLGSNQSLAALTQRVNLNQVPRWQAHIVGPIAFSSIQRPLSDYDRWLVIVGHLEGKYQLSESRQALLFESAASVTGSFPEEACSGKEYVFQVFVGSLLPGFRLFWWLEQIELGTVPPVQWKNLCSGSGGPSGCYAPITLPSIDPGWYELRSTVRVAFMRLDDGDVPPWQIPFPEDRILWSTKKVLIHLLDIQSK